MRIWLTALLLLYLFFRCRRDGGKPEQWTASVFIIGFLVEVAYNHIAQPDSFRVLNPFFLALDLGTFVYLMWIALRANRWWPLWTTALQLIILSAHLAAYLKIPAMRGVYWAMTSLTNYPQYLIVFFGVIFHSRLKLRVGDYPDWDN
jgi:hypothetical protein